MSSGSLLETPQTSLCSATSLGGANSKPWFHWGSSWFVGDSGVGGKLVHGS